MKICSVPLAIGMTKATFVEKVSQSCDIVKVPVGEDSWVLKEHGPRGEPVGMVEFSAGRISAVSREWTPAGGHYQPADFARSLVSAIESALQGRNAVTGTVSYAVKREPDMILYQMRLTLPDHREVQVNLIENPAKPNGERAIMLGVKESILK